MTTPPRRRLAAIVLAAVGLLVCAAIILALVTKNGRPTLTGCTGSPTRTAVIQLHGQHSTAKLAVYLGRGQACASVHGPSHAVVGVFLEACTNAAGPGLPGLCTSTADTFTGQLALHKLGDTTVTIATPTQGYVIARGSLGYHSEVGSAAIRLTVAPQEATPGRSPTPTHDRSHPPTPVPARRAAASPQGWVTHQPPTARAA